MAALREVVDIHRQALVPQRESIVARQQERQNFMLIGVFELIQAKVAEYDAYEAYLEAVRDYWLARVELARVVGRCLPSDAGIEARTPSLEDILGPEEAPAMDHSAHGGMDHSMHGEAKPAEAEEMDHSMHEGMDHSGHDMPADPEPAAAPEEPEDDETSDQHDHHHHGATP